MISQTGSSLTLASAIYIPQKQFAPFVSQETSQLGRLTPTIGSKDMLPLDWFKPMKTLG